MTCGRERHGSRERETNRCGEVFVLIWTRGKVVGLGPCIPAETMKVRALIGLHTMAEENALRSDGDSSPELRDVWRYGCPRSPVCSSGGGDWAGSEDTFSFEDYEHNVDNLAHGSLSLNMDGL